MSKLIADYFLASRRDLNLRQAFYQQTSCYGHFGRDCFPWEQAKELDIDWLDVADAADSNVDDIVAAKKIKIT